MPGKGAADRASDTAAVTIQPVTADNTRADVVRHTKADITETSAHETTTDATNNGHRRNSTEDVIISFSVLVRLSGGMSIFAPGAGWSKTAPNTGVYR